MDSSPGRRPDLIWRELYGEGHHNPLDYFRGRGQYGIVNRSVCKRIDWQACN